jgi:hypothetical protein
MAFLKRKKPSFEGEGLALFTDVEGARSIFICGVEFATWKEDEND